MYRLGAHRKIGCDTLGICTSLMGYAPPSKYLLLPERGPHPSRQDGADPTSHFVIGIFTGMIHPVSIIDRFSLRSRYAFSHLVQDNTYLPACPGLGLVDEAGK